MLNRHIYENEALLFFLSFDILFRFGTTLATNNRSLDPFFATDSFFILSDFFLVPTHSCPPLCPLVEIELLNERLGNLIQLERGCTYFQLLSTVHPTVDDINDLIKRKGENFFRQAS